MFELTEIDNRPVKLIKSSIVKIPDKIDCPVWEQGKRIIVINEYQFLDNGEIIQYRRETLARKWGGL